MIFSFISAITPINPVILSGSISPGYIPITPSTSSGSTLIAHITPIPVSKTSSLGKRVVSSEKIHIGYNFNEMFSEDEDYLPLKKKQKTN